MSDNPDEKFEISPKVKSLIKAFESALSPVIVYQHGRPPLSNRAIAEYDLKVENPCQTHVTSSDENLKEQSEKQEKCVHGRHEKQDFSKLASPIAVGNVDHSQGDELPINSCKAALNQARADTSIRVTPSHLNETFQQSKEVLMQQLINGLKEHFSKMNETSSNQSLADSDGVIIESSKASHLTVAIPDDSPETALERDNVDIKDVESSFSISFNTVDKVSSPLSTRYGDADQHFSTLIKYCQSTILLVTPKRSREKHYTSLVAIAEKETDVDKTRYMNYLSGRCKNCFREKWVMTKVGLTVPAEAVNVGVKVIFQSLKIVLFQSQCLAIDDWVAWISLLLSMIASLYPTVARCNSAMTSFIMFSYFVEVSL